MNYQHVAASKFEANRKADDSPLLGLPTKGEGNRRTTAAEYSAMPYLFLDRCESPEHDSTEDALFPVRT